MDITERGFCFRAMELVTKSPLGIYTSPLITKYAAATKSKLDLVKIKEKVDKNEYKSVKEWYDDINICIQQVLKVTGNSTPIGLAISTIKKKVNDFIAENVTSVNPEIFLDRCRTISRIRRQLNEIFLYSPMNATELNRSFSLVENSKNFEADENLPHVSVTKENFSDLIQELNNLSTDEEVKNIVLSVLKYQDNKELEKGKYTVDFDKMSPYVLELIKKKLENRNM